VESPVDHLSPWLKTFLGFIGITDITVLAADQLAIKEKETVERVRSQISNIA
jgi:FMN-dependent NADH-azoreductase